MKNKKIEYKNKKLGAAPLLAQILLTELSVIMGVLTVLEPSFLYGLYAMIILTLICIMYNNWQYFKVKYINLIYCIAAITLIFITIMGLF